jgi:hypothetical protein
MRRILGYNQFGHQVTFSPEPERRSRDRIPSNPETPYTYTSQLMSNQFVSISAFLAGRSSNITCVRPDDIWASCGPIYGLGLPLIINVVILAYKLLSNWWIARTGAAERSNGFILPPLMCHTELKKRANDLSCFGKDGQGGILAHNFQMQRDGLLWGCPWRPTLKQVRYWL